MTIYANAARRFGRAPRPRRERWELPDGDFVDLDFFEGPGGDAPLVVICHGLEGSSRSGYVTRLAAELAVRGLAAAALNFRGCSGELNRLPRFYHSGETGDLALTIERLAEERPRRSLLLAGFSLGGNVVVKYLGEQGDRVSVAAAAVASVPFDLALCARVLDRPGAMTFVYRERFLRSLRRKAAAKGARLPGCIDIASIRRARTFREYDRYVTAPLHGFASADDYWARSSSGPLVEHVARPLLVIAAKDDPFIPPEAIPVDAARRNPQVRLEVFDSGGHVGFVSGPPWRPWFWAEARMAAFLAEAAAAPVVAMRRTP